MEPLPSSPIDPGWTTAVDPSLQRTVAVAPMRTMIMTTAGLARKTADWSSDSVAASDTGGTLAARRPASTAITGARAVVEIVPSLACWILGCDHARSRCAAEPALGLISRANHSGKPRLARRGGGRPRPSATEQLFRLPGGPSWPSLSATRDHRSRRLAACNEPWRDRQLHLGRRGPHPRHVQARQVPGRDPAVHRPAADRLRPRPDQGEGARRRRTSSRTRLDNLDPQLRKASGLRLLQHVEVRLREAPRRRAAARRQPAATTSPASATNMREVLEKFDFDNTISKLDEASLLFKVVERFKNVDLSPTRSTTRDGHVFEELIRKFNEALDENPGEHFTPREVVRLMVDLMLAGDEARDPPQGHGHPHRLRPLLRLRRHAHHRQGAHHGRAAQERRHLRPRSTRRPTSTCSARRSTRRRSRSASRTCS